MQSPSSHSARSVGITSNTSFLSSLQPSNPISSSTNLNIKSSPDFNQNKTAMSNSQHKLSRTEMNITNRCSFIS